jgi:sigma-E factor negative regulatory protein RseB
MSRFLVACLACGAFAVPALAQQPPANEGLRLLERIATAAQQLNYTGVFVYQSGNRSETSRITHLGDGGNEFERLEVLDGSPREVVRQNDEVRCYLPESHLVIVERRSSQRSFPSLLPGCLAGLTEHYAIHRGPNGRVAGMDCQSILIEPKDDIRYGHQLWFDPKTGLLMKAVLVNEKGQPVETFAFTEVSIGGPAAKAMRMPEMQDGSWRMHIVQSSETKRDDGQWVFRTALPGFRRQPGMKRQLHPGGPEGMHVIFSDGLAAVSVFIDPVPASASADASAGAPFSIGGINVVKRYIGGYQLVVMGDVPAVALREFADGIEPRER